MKLIIMLLSLSFVKCMIVCLRLNVLVSVVVIVKWNSMRLVVLFSRFLFLSSIISWCGSVMCLSMVFVVIVLGGDMIVLSVKYVVYGSVGII